MLPASFDTGQATQAYAITAPKARGLTGTTPSCSACPSCTATGSYVSLSRGRESNWPYFHGHAVRAASRRLFVGVARRAGRQADRAGQLPSHGRGDLRCAGPNGNLTGTTDGNLVLAYNTRNHTISIKDGTTDQTMTCWGSSQLERTQAGPATLTCRD